MLLRLQFPNIILSIQEQRDSQIEREERKIK